VVFAEATVLNCIRIPPVAEPSLNVIVPAVPVFTAYKPRSRIRPLNIGAAIDVPEPALTLPAGLPTAAIAVIVVKKVDPVAVPESAPVIDSVTAVPVSSVPVAVNDIPESSPALRMVMFLGSSKVTVPPEARAPPITKLALLPTDAAVEIPSGSAVAASTNVDWMSEDIVYSSLRNLNVFNNKCKRASSCCVHSVCNITINSSFR